VRTKYEEGGNVGFSKSNKVRSKEFQGVSIYHSTKRPGDECYYIRYRNAEGKPTVEKVGWKSEGYNEEESSKVRSMRVHAIRHGKELPYKIPEVPKLIEQVEGISDSLTKMELEWLEPYLFMAIGLFKGMVPPMLLKGLGPEVKSKKNRDNSKKGENMKMGMEFTRFLQAVELVGNEIYTELPLQQLRMLLIVADREGTDQIDFQKLLGVPAGTVSRNLARIGCKFVEDKQGKQINIGYGMVDVRPHPRDPKSNQVFLSKKGKLFIEKILDALQADKMLR
jgi:hypothetical protein